MPVITFDTTLTKEPKLCFPGMNRFEKFSRLIKTHGSKQRGEEEAKCF